MGALPYVVGRRRRDLAAVLYQADQSRRPLVEQDKTFAGTRLDEKTITGIDGAKFAHCTFLNIGFKEVTLKECNFEDCVFVGCYFRKATWHRCRFQACRFIDCQFTGLQIVGSLFFYSRFSDCFIPYNRIKSSLPGEANLKRELAHNLATEAAKLGFSEEASKFRWCEIEAHEQHLRGALWHEEPWYETHYPGVLDRLGAGLRLVSSRLHRQLWGYGEKGRVLLRNLVVLVLIIFPFGLLPNFRALISRVGCCFAPGGAVAQGDGPWSPKLAQTDRPLAVLQTPEASALGGSSAGANNCNRAARS